jgi:ring-1,2-phenylacetyl-CoA epoxidase subunit PaaC
VTRQTSRTGAPAGPDVATYALGLGDDVLVLAQRLSEWTARAPQLEDDVALLNIALDLVGQARNLLTLAGGREDPVRTEDDLAFWRDETEFRNAHIMELDGGDFGRTIARQFLVSAWHVPLWDALRSSTDPELAAIADKAVKEARYHVTYARHWLVRLGDGTPESRRRVQAGLEDVWPYAGELFELDPLTERLVAVGVAPDPALVEPVWREAVEAALAEATLVVPPTVRLPTGGRRGVHTSAFGPLLAQMQHLHRSHPGASW